MFSADGKVRDVVYLGLYTRYLVELDGGGDLVVVEQNLNTTSMDVMKARGQKVVCSGKRNISACWEARMLNRLSTFLYRRPKLVLGLMLLPPLVWFVVVYLGSLATMLLIVSSIWMVSPGRLYTNSHCRPI